MDPNQADRQAAHELKPNPNDSQAEDDFKKLSEELDQLQAHFDQLKTRKKNIQLIND